MTYTNILRAYMREYFRQLRLQQDAKIRSVGGIGEVAAKQEGIK